MSALTLLSTTKLPPENESCTSINLYQMDEETYHIVYCMSACQRGRKSIDDPEVKELIGDIFCDGIITYEEYIMDLLSLYEEPDYAVLPGGLYHRYAVEIIYDVVVVAETIAYNV